MRLEPGSGWCLLNPPWLVNYKFGFNIYFTAFSFWGFYGLFEPIDKPPPTLYPKYSARVQLVSFMRAFHIGLSPVLSAGVVT
jgi:hypothetical protein